MPRKAPPGPIHISSPVQSPSLAYSPDRSPGTPGTPGSRRGGYNGYATAGSSGRSTPRSAVGPGGGRSTGSGARRGAVPLDFSTPSPTHDFLEAFHSHPDLPSTHTPIENSQSPFADSNALASPNLVGSPSEKTFANNNNAQYSSSRLLSGSRAYPSPRDRPGNMGVLEAPTTRTNNGYGRHGYSDTEYKPSRSCVPASKTKRRWLFWGLPIGLVIIAAIAIGAAVGASKSKQGNTSSAPGQTSGGNGKTGASAKPSATGATTVANDFGVKGSGSDGSTVDKAEGGSFTYSNSFGGTWAVDPYNPYTVSGRAQEWTPSLLEEWQWGKDTIRGVNLGGWLVTEPFIVSNLYEQYQTTTPVAVDEYTLSQAMGSDLAEKMEEHYKTFITEKDFADIAGAGLNWIRVPIGYWAIETTEDEPYLPQVSWRYFVKAIGWARKYGLRILLDFHALPGSQNGWNHSGKAGTVNWMYGVMGIANAQRHLEQIRTLVEFISQDGIKEVVPMLSLVNEVQAEVVGKDVMAAFYYQAYEMIRGITGFGANNGPIIAIHEGFYGVAAWETFLSGADRLALDQHPYLAFVEPNNNAWDANARTACGWGGGTNDSSTNYGITIGGEWSLAVNNCGKWLNGVGSTPTYESSGTGTCGGWEDWQNWTEDRKTGIASYALANMDALQNWFFWTWKIANSTQMGYAPSPMWHYQLGLEQGWIPRDPRVAGGYCGRVMQVGGNQFAGTYPASATGGVPSPTIAQAEIASHSAWPPTSMGPSFTANQISLFPTLTQTGDRVTLATAAHPTDITIGAGWANANDKIGAWARVEGCSYPDEYNANDVGVLPTALCTGTKARRGVEARITQAPRR